MNKLPEKLNLLRKSSGLPQSEIAKRLMVPVSEYMNWENGNSIPSIYQLKSIAGLFHVELAALLDNTMSFIAPRVEDPAASATIPFQNSNLGATQQLDTEKMDMFGGTKQMSTVTNVDAARTQEYHVIKETDDEEEAVKPKNRSPKKEEKKPFLGKKNIILIACISLAAIAVLAAVLLFGKGGSNLSLTEVNRLALNEKTSLYVDGAGSLETLGDSMNTSEMTGLVQVSSYSDFAVGLKKNGKVVTTDSGLKVSGWSDITMVAAGQYHAVGLKKDGTVVCAGSETACAVKDWSDIKSVYAGNEVTVGVRKDGSIVASGGVHTQGISNVKSCAISNGGLYCVLKDGTVKSVAIGGSGALAVNDLTGVTQIAAGDTLVAGLKKDGTVKIVGSDENLVKEAAGWKNVRYIAAHGNTVIAITNDGLMYGAGDNTYGQYENTANNHAPTPTPTATAGAKLDTVTGISLDLTSVNLQLSWNKVENADYYTVSVSPSIGELGKSAGTSASIPVTSLEDGTTYTITVTACNNDSEKYPDSTPASTSYTYTQQKVQLDAPTNLMYTEDNGAWIFSWNPVEHADQYTFTFNGSSQVTSSTYITIAASQVNILDPGQSVTVSVSAGSYDDKYTESAESSIYAQRPEEAEPTPEPTETPDAGVTGN